MNCWTGLWRFIHSLFGNDKYWPWYCYSLFKNPLLTVVFLPLGLKLNNMLSCSRSNAPTSWSFWIFLFFYTCVCHKTVTAADGPCSDTTNANADRTLNATNAIDVDSLSQFRKLLYLKLLRSCFTLENREPKNERLTACVPGQWVMSAARR